MKMYGFDFFSNTFSEHAKSKYVPSNDRPDELDSLS